MTGPETKIIRHLSENDLDRLLTETDDKKVSKRLLFVKRLCKDITLENTSDDVRMAQSTESRWAKLWNKGGLGFFTLSFGGGRPPRSSTNNGENGYSLCSKTVNGKRSRRYSM